MAFKRCIFLCFMIIGAISPFVANAGQDRCAPGKLAWSTGVSDCPAGCVCPKALFVKDYSEEKNFCNRKRDDLAKGQTNCEDITSGEYEGFRACEGSGHDNKHKGPLYRCPKDFPNSAAGSKYAFECSKTCVHTGGKGPIIHNKKIHCDAGYFLPYEKETCKKCETIMGEVCPGGDFYPNCNSNQGRVKCGGGEKPNDDLTACVKKDADTQSVTEETNTINCSAGMYLKKNVCVACNTSNKYYCPGGDFPADNKEHGLETCGAGYVANDAHTACIEKAPDVITVIVPNGKYLKANEEKPVDCLNVSNKYCPGGTYEKSAKTQGLYDCPLNSRQNATKDGCNITFTTEQLQYGYSKDLNPAGCWIYEDPNNYKDCVLGL